MEKELELLEIKGFVRRRKKVFILSFLGIFIVGVITALSLKPIYTSKAMIRIEDQEIPEKYIQSTITDFAEERIQKISRQILSRSKLVEIIERFDLYPELKDKKTKTELVEKMRKSIELQTISAGMQNNGGGKGPMATVAFTLAYDGTDPVKVQKVADTLSKLYLEEDTRARERRTEGATVFLQSELHRLKKEIDLQEKVISEFKQNHLRELPDDRSYNLQAISRFERSLDDTERKMQLLRERKHLLQVNLQETEPLRPIVIDGKDVAINPAERLKRLRLELASMQSIYSEKHPDIRKKKNEIRKLEQEVKISDDSVAKIKRLKELEVKYASEKARLGPKHPNLKKLQKEIAILKEQVDNLITETAKERISEEKPDNPVYINFKTQITSIEMEMDALLEEKQQLIIKIDEYQARIENAPIVEKELSALTRDYEMLKQKYSEISNKLMNAELVQEMEGKEKGRRFNITASAYLPEKPTKPNRLMIIVLSFLLACVISSAIVVFQEYLDDSIKTPNQLKDLTNIPVFSAISYIETNEEKRQRLIKKLIWASATLSVIVIFLVLINQYFMKLDQAWKIVIERIMLIA